ncbi:MAG: class I SAM-dependent methyltransferase [Actinomycetota bacterium]
MTDAAYDTIGRGYARTRRPDPRIAAQILAALGEARSVVNVGAGAGSYEPNERDVVAVERSMEMIGQRPATAAPAVQGDAMALPFADDTFDAALAVLTMHHWPDQAAGAEELRRVARSRIVVLTHYTDELKGFWLTEDYFPEVADLDREVFLTSEHLGELLDIASVEPVMVPIDCMDGFLAAFWARPEAYLDEAVRAGISFFHRFEPAVIVERLDRLADDLSSGLWEERHGHLRHFHELDFGYRLVVARA